MSRSVLLLLLVFGVQIYEQLGRLHVLLSHGTAEDVDFEFGLIEFFERWRNWVSFTVNGHFGIFFCLIVGTTNLVGFLEGRFMPDGSWHSLVDEIGGDEPSSAVAVEDVGL